MKSSLIRITKNLVAVRKLISVHIYLMVCGDNLGLSETWNLTLEENATIYIYIVSKAITAFLLHFVILIAMETLKSYLRKN